MQQAQDEGRTFKYFYDMAREQYPGLTYRREYMLYDWRSVANATEHTGELQGLGYNELVPRAWMTPDQYNRAFDYTYIASYQMKDPVTGLITTLHYTFGDENQLTKGQVLDRIVGELKDYYNREPDEYSGLNLWMVETHK